MEFDFDIEHRRGIKYHAPDALSRLNTDGEDDTPLEDELTVHGCEENLSDTYTEYEEGYPSENEDRGNKHPTDDNDVCNEVSGDDTEPPSPNQPNTDSAAEPFTAAEFLKAQSTDRECSQMEKTIGTGGSEFDIDRYGFLIRMFKIDGVNQLVVPANLRKLLLKMAYSSLMAGHPGASRMYSTMRVDYNWRNMENDVQETVANCESCIRKRGTFRKYNNQLKSFPPNGPLEYIAMDFLGPLPKTARGNQYVLVITDL